MADILTQLQTCLDQLATQFYATLCYLTTYHDNSPAIVPSNIPDAAPSLARIPKNSSAPPVPAQISLTTGAPEEEAEVAAGVAGGQTPHPPKRTAAAAHDHEHDPNDPLSEGQAPAPDSPRTFSRRQRELARDLIIKEQQIEYLISVLPGIGASEEEQEKRIRELARELRAVEQEREGKARELRRLRRRLEGVLGGVQIWVYGDHDRTHDL